MPSVQVIVVAVLLGILNGFVTLRFRAIWHNVRPTGAATRPWRGGLAGYQSTIKALPVLVIGGWAMVVALFTGHSLKGGKAPASPEVVAAIISMSVLFVCVGLTIAIIAADRPRFLIPPAFRVRR